jgi:hypothetical protein
MGKFIKPFLVAQEIRPTYINWPSHLKGIVDAYEGYRGVPHGVQKDAIQNSWDARKYKKGQGWSFVFELVKGKAHTFLTMTDRGTHGLTGRILTEEDMLKDLHPIERWGRFENLAFTKELTGESVPLGSRGRGKFIFVGASKENAILYDSLREDGTYRFGFRGIEKIRSPVAAYDEEKGKEKLVEMTGGTLKPLTEVGTRVVIVDPVDDLVHAIRSGEIARYIGETWWEILTKYKAEIIQRDDGHEVRVEPPPDFVLPEEDTREYRIWIRKNKRIPGGYKIKKLHIASRRKGEVASDIRGISVQRGGMKICCVDPSRYLPHEISDTIYGYITLDESAELELREAEGVEHYTFDFRKTAANAIRQYIWNELNEFAKSKLGWGADIREIRRRHQRNAERFALNAINRIAREIGLLGLGGGTKPGGGGGEWKEIRIQMPQFKFPRERDLRVDYGEALGNISARVVNASENRIRVKFKMYIHYSGKLIDTYVEKDLSIQPDSQSEMFGPFKEVFSEKRHLDKGRYTIVARILSLMEENRGEVLDERKKNFYLEENPPARGLFEKFEPVEYPEGYQKMIGEAIPGESGGYKIQYNIAHPACRAAESIEADLAEYLFRLAVHELCRIDLLQEKPKLFEEADRETPDAVLQKTLRLKGDFIFRYLS